jgi:hypothetical protein
MVIFFFARIVKLWKSTNSKNYEKPLNICLILKGRNVTQIIFNYFHMQGHKIHAMVGSKLFNKFELSLKEEVVYIMYYDF